MSEQYERVDAAIGVHPNDGNSWDKDSLNILEKLASHPKVVALGEIGLDYYHQTTPREHQQEIFQQQLELAASLALPVIVHCRQAYEDTWRILNQWVSHLQKTQNELWRCPGVLHSFNNSAEVGNQFVQMNFKIGIGGPITYKNAVELQRAVQQLPLSSLVLETDSPFLPPHPHRGKRNEPAWLRFSAQKMAEIKKQPLEEIAQSTTQNALELFTRRMSS